MATTDVETLQSANWERLESDVVDRIRILRQLVRILKPSRMIDEKIANDLILPNLKLLGTFCEDVSMFCKDNNAETDDEADMSQAHEEPA